MWGTLSWSQDKCQISAAPATGHQSTLTFTFWSHNLEPLLTISISSSTDSCLPQVHEGQGALPDQGSDAWLQPLPDCLQLVDVPGRMGLLHDR